MRITLLLLFLTGCAVGPNYQAPENAIPDTWKTEDRECVLCDEHEPLTHWWRCFHDPLLDKYIEMGAQCNNTLLSLEANILEARAFRTVEAAPLFPQLGGDFNATKSYFSKNGPVFAIGLASGNLSGGGGSTTGSPAPFGSSPTSPLTGLPFTVQIPQQQNLFNALLDASWEIDFFGKTRRKVEAAEAQIQSTIAARDRFLLTLFGEIASNYIEIRGFQCEAKLLEENIALLEAQLAIIDQNQKAGLDTLIDVEAMRAEVSQKKSLFPQVVANIYRGIYLLSVLTGQLPEALSCELLPFQELPPLPKSVAVGMRSHLLRRRPDVIEAERKLASATAHIGVAVASFFPTFTLLGDAGLQSLIFPKLFEANSKTWAFGGDISLPIFRGGSLVGNLRMAKAAEKSAAFHYQQVVLDAVKDAETSLAKYLADLKTRRLFAETVKAHRHIVYLNQKQNRQGLTNQLTLLESQLKLNRSEQLALAVEAKTLLNTVSLYKALGGGWQCNNN